jgi:hypothetical protein
VSRRKKRSLRRERESEFSVSGSKPKTCLDKAGLFKIN